MMSEGRREGLTEQGGGAVVRSHRALQAVIGSWDFILITKEHMRVMEYCI